MVTASLGFAFVILLSMTVWSRVSVLCQPGFSRIHSTSASPTRLRLLRTGAGNSAGVSEGAGVVVFAGAFAALSKGAGFVVSAGALGGASAGFLETEGFFAGALEAALAGSWAGALVGAWAGAGAGAGGVTCVSATAGASSRALGGRFGKSLAPFRIPRRIWMSASSSSSGADAWAPPT